MTADKANTSEPRRLNLSDAEVAQLAEEEAKRLGLQDVEVVARLWGKAATGTPFWPVALREITDLRARVQEQAAQIERLTKKLQDARRALVLMDFPPIKGPDGDFVYQQVAAARAAMKGETNG